MRCRVLNCGNSSKRKNLSLSYFSFPADDSVAQKWVEFCRQTKPFNLYYSGICQLHFAEDAFENLMQYNMGFASKRTLKRGAVPTIYMPDKSPEGSPTQDDVTNDEQYNDEGTQIITLNLGVSNETEGDNQSLDENDKASPALSSYYSADGLDVFEELDNAESLKRENELLKNETKMQRIELAALKRATDLQLERHSSEVEPLQKSIESLTNELKNMEDKLASLFSKGQITKLKSWSKRRNWAVNDIAQSITLYAVSPKAYRILAKQGFPLPSVRTLKCWVQDLDFSRGLLQPVFRLLAATTHMEERHKLCVLSFGQMKVRGSNSYDVLSDTTPESTNYVQVAVLRGLLSKWKQPVFYDFNRKMTLDLLQSIMQMSLKSGYNIVAVISALEGSNGSIFNSLRINEYKPWFIFNGKKVCVLADVPHLLKSLRNNFLDHGFLINRKPVRKKMVLELLSCTSEDLSVTGTHRQQVKAATELFSSTMVQAITNAASCDHLTEQSWIECLRLFKITNYWFDMFNVKVPRTKSKKHCYAYGLAIDQQDKILDEMTDLIKNIRVIGNFNLLAFQKGIIQTNNALKMLFDDIKYRFNAKYVLTYRLNQDVLENCFDMIRSKAGLYNYPDYQEFKYGLKLYLLGHTKGAICDTGNVEEDDPPDNEIMQPPLTGILLKNLNSESDLWPVEEVEFEELAGYVCHKQPDDISTTSYMSNDDPLSIS